MSEKDHRNNATARALAGLTPPEAKVLRMRFGIDLDSHYSVDEITERLEVTRQRIREIEAKALKRLRNTNSHRHGDDPEPAEIF